MSRSSSAVVDSKVVEMSFENSNFERNAATSLSTLQKLKEALNFGTTKDGFDKLGDSVKKADFNPLVAGIESAKNGMSALEAVSFGFFSKIGAQIEQTAQKYASMFSTLKMAQDGFAEYETKMQSVQTILMGAKTTEGLPVTLDMVNQKLEELNTYADKTIYSFSDMTSSIGKFTNAGVDLDTAVAAIQGISNEAALSGANAQQASHAMYNFAQALSSGAVKLIDWKSIENANMATVEFKQALIDTAVEVGTLTKEGDKFISTTTDMSGKVSDAFNATTGFNDALSSQWMTTEVLTKTLGMYADGTTEIGKKAFQAATEVKTFTQLIDTLKEAMGSGWAQTWELVVGDFEESKQLFTTLSNAFGGLIDSQAKARNALLKEGLGKPAVQVTEEYIKNLGMGAIQTNRLRQALMEVGQANGVAFTSNDARGFFESLDSGWLTMDMLKSKMEELNSTGIDSGGMSKSLDDINEAALRVIRGEFGNEMPERIKKLNDEGFNGEKIQEYVDELYRLTEGTWDVNEAIMEEARANVGLTESVGGVSGEYDKFLKIDAASYKKSGRELLFDALKTSIFAFKNIAASVKDAMQEVFPPMTADTIYNIARNINQASKALRRFSIKHADDIRTVFLGIFKAFDLVLHTGKTLIGSIFKGITNFFKGMTSGSGGIGAFIVKVAELISKFHDWVIENEIVEKGVKAVGDTISSVINAIGNWIDAFTKVPEVQAVIEKFGDAFSYIRDNLPTILTKAKTSLGEFGTSVVEAFKYSKSPKEFFQGVKAAFEKLWTDISGSTVYEKIAAGFEQIGKSLKTFFINLGNNADGSRNTFGKIVDAFSNFKLRMQNLFKGLDENGEKIDLFAGIRIAFGNLWADLAASGIKEKIETALGIVWTTINDFFMTIGTNADGTLNTFGKVWTGLVEGFTWIRDKALAAKNALVQFFTEHKLGKFFADSFNDISTGVVAFFTGIPKFVEGAVEKFKDFFSSVQDLGGFKFENLGQIWENFKATLGKYFTGSDLFEPIVTAFSNIKDRVVEKVAEFGINLGEIKDKIVDFVENLKTTFSNFSLPGVFEALVDFFVGSKDKVADGAKSAGDGIVGFFDNIRNRISNIDVGAIKKIVTAFLLFKTLMFIKSLVKPVEQLISAIAAEKKAHANFLNKAALLETAAAIGIFALIIAGLSKLSVGEIAKGIISIGLMLTLLGLFGILTSKFGDAASMAAVGTMALELSFSVILLTVAIKLIGELIQHDPGSIVAGVIGLVALFVALGIVAKKMSDLNGLGAMMSGGAVLEVIGALFGALLLIRLIAGMDIGTLIKGALEVLVLAGILALVMKMMKKAVGDKGLSISIGIAGLAACILAIAGALWIMSTIDIPSMIVSAIALGALMVILTKVLKSAAELKAGTGAMIGLAAVILSLALSIGILSLIEPTALIAPTIAMGALIALLALLAKMASGLGPATAAVYGLVALVAVIGVVLLLLTTMTDPDSVLKVAVGIAAVLLGVAIAARLAVGVGAAAGPALIGLAVMAAFIAGFVALAAVIGALAGDGSTIQNGINVIITVMGGLGTAIGKFIANLVTESFDALPKVAESIVEFMRKLSELNDIGMVDIGPLLEALGAIFAVSLVGFADSLLSIVSELEEGKSAAAMLADDMIAIADAFEHYQTTMDRVDGIEINSEPLLEAVANVFVASLAGFGDSLLSIVSELESGKTSVQLIADDMEALATGFEKYAETMTRFSGIDIDTEDLNNAIAAVGTASLTGFGESLASILTELESGKTSVQTVADDMSALADGFSTFAEAMGKYGDITIDTTGLNTIVETIGTISLQGFFTSLGNLLLGEDQISQVDQFATDMGTLASALSAWQTEMEPLAEINVPTDAIAKIKEALDSIKEGGIIDSVLNFFGVDTTPDYTSFSEGVKGLGKAINDFSNSLGENFDEAKLTTAIDAIKKLSEVGVALGDVDFGGWFHDGVLTTFANELVEMVPNLNQFVDSFSNLESFTKVATAVSKISSSVSTLSTIKFGKSDLMNTEMISQIKQNIDSVIQIFSNIQTADISAVNRFSSALTKLNNINLAEAAKKVSAAASTKESGKETGKQLSESIASGVDSSIIARALTKAVKAAVSGIDTSKYTTLGKNLGTQVSKGIQRASDTLKESAKTIGTNFTTALANAIRSTTSKVTTASGNMAKSAATTANNYRSQFQTAGSNFSSGLANGILANRSAAINAAATVAAEALRAAKEKLDMHSPSRETEKVGKFFDLGFARGISRFGSTVLSESVGVADIAMKGLQRAVDLAADMAMGDGIGSPVITPILDLSEIQNGASEIGSILGSSRPDVTLGNLRAISFNADALRQQRTSNDLLTAIQTLGSDLSNSPSGDTYIVNGITYDDGSNVSDAVRSLIRAVKVERRA